MVIQDGKAVNIVTPTAAAVVAAEQDSLLTQSDPAALAAVPAVAAAVVPSRETTTEAAPVVPAVAAVAAGMAAGSHKAANAVHMIPKKVRRIHTVMMVKTQVEISPTENSPAAKADSKLLPALLGQVKVVRAEPPEPTETVEPS